MASNGVRSSHAISTTRLTSAGESSVIGALVGIMCFVQVSEQGCVFTRRPQHILQVSLQANGSPASSSGDRWAAGTQNPSFCCQWWRAPALHRPRRAFETVAGADGCNLRPSRSGRVKAAPSGLSQSNVRQIRPSGARRSPEQQRHAPRMRRLRARSRLAIVSLLRKGPGLSGCPRCHRKCVCSQRRYRRGGRSPSRIRE